MISNNVACVMFTCLICCLLSSFDPDIGDIDGKQVVNKVFI